jgi:glycerol-3-phosphate acyltransferase PlsX
MRIAVDAMGGDNAPSVVVQGAVEAASQAGIHITLVGEERALAKELGSHRSKERIKVHHCTEVVGMEEPPLKAIRQKKEASIRIAFDLVKRGDADAVVSAGNSGATLAAGILCLGRMESVERPAIAGIFPGENGPVILIDVGANVDCRPAHLFQFGVMAQAFAVSCLGIENPKIGLLSIGEEGGKGNEQVRLAQELFKESQLNFTGNVEGRDIFSGKVEIIVCDGFVGNVALKLSEGMAQVMTKVLKRKLSSSYLGRISLILGRGALRRFQKKFDYEEYGGAPLLGLKGVGIVCHGGSSQRAIRNAVKLAAQYAESQVLDRMRAQLNAFIDFTV